MLLAAGILAAGVLVAFAAMIEGAAEVRAAPVPHPQPGLPGDAGPSSMHAPPPASRTDVPGSALATDGVPSTDTATPSVDSSDTTLSALTLEDVDGDEISLTPRFAPSTRHYTTTVSARVESVTLRAIANHPAASIVILNDDDASTPTEATRSLETGDNNGFTVTVEAEDGTIRAYFVAVRRHAPPPAPTDCPTPNDWCAAMRVGHAEFKPAAHELGQIGYHADRLAQGQLSSDVFSFRSQNYSVLVLMDAWLSVGGTIFSRLLFLELDLGLPNGSVLTVDGMEFMVDADTRSNRAGYHSWELLDPPVSLGWTAGDLVTASLQLPDVPVLSIDDGTATEGSGVAFEVALDATHTSDVTVKYSTPLSPANTASRDPRSPGGADFTAVTDATLTIAAGMTSGTFTIATGDDSTDEPDETFTVKLSDPQNAALSVPGTARGTIVDNDDPPAVSSIAAVPQSEHASGSFTVNLDAVSGQQITIGYATQPGGAHPATPDVDYAAQAGTLIFKPGQQSETVFVPHLEDTLDEADETYQLRLFSPANVTLPVGLDTQTNSIIDNDALPVVSIRPAAAGETYPLEFDVSLSSKSGRDVTVAYTVMGGTATAGVDYTAPAVDATLTIGAGQRLGTIVVPTLTDALDDDGETLTVTLGSPMHAVLGTASAVGTIFDDPVLAVRVPIRSLHIDEGETATYTAQLLAQPTGAVTLMPSVPPGSSLAVAPTSVTFSTLDYATPKTFVVTAGDDTDKEDESVTVTHGIQGGGYDSVVVPSVSVAVADNDKTTPGAPGQLRATAGNGAVTLSWQQPTDDGGHQLTGYQVQVDTSGWTSTGGTGTSQTVTGLENEMSYEFWVRARNLLGEGAATGPVEATPSETATTPGLTGGALAGGGGGGGPTPSDLDFEWNVTRDIEELDAGHGSATGMWADGSTLWLLENGSGADDAVYAYDLESSERVEDIEFELDDRNLAPRGLWSDGSTMWVSDSGREKLFGYEFASGERLADSDLALPRGNREARGIWSHGSTMWVLDGHADALFAYDLASGDLLGEYALHDDNDDPHGIWSDRVTVWVSDHNDKRLFAYRLPVVDGEEAGTGADEDLERVGGEEFKLLSRAGNNSPRGLWSDGDVMYVADASDGRVYTYNMPDAIDARLASLSLSEVDIGEFSPSRAEYDGVAGKDATQTTVEALTRQRHAEAAIDPPDADADTEGHQVAVGDGTEIVVTVTSEDGMRIRVYRVRFGEPDVEDEPAAEEETGEPSPDCLRGLTTGRFSLVTYEGGTVDDFEACANSQLATAAYLWHDGAYVSYILGAPEFVNRPFRELFPDGLPPVTPLIVQRPPQ